MFDDVERGQIPPLSLLKRLLDRYGMQVPVFVCVVGGLKGGFAHWKPKTIVLTSNSHPFEWWPELSDMDKVAIERRIKDITIVELYISSQELLQRCPTADQLTRSTAAPSADDRFTAEHRIAEYISVPVDIYKYHTTAISAAAF